MSGECECKLQLGDMNALMAVHAEERMGMVTAFNNTFLQQLDRVMLKNYSETDPIQAAAIKEIQRGPAPAPGPGVSQKPE